MCAETDSKRKAAKSQEASSVLNMDGRPPKCVQVSKSLLEEEDETSEMDQVPASRNPSFEGGARGNPIDSFRDLSYQHNPEEYKKEWESIGSGGPLSCNQGALPLCQGDLVGIPVCQGQLAEQIDFMTQCRHPLEFLNMFHDQSDREAVEEALTASMYTIPQSCEYCGAESTKECTSTCNRPKSFFRKKRPPFCPAGENWDPATGYPVVHEIEESQEVELKPLQRKRSSFLAFSGFFSRKEAA